MRLLSAALLAMGIAMEAQTAKELASNERDERARMTSVERAAKVAVKVVERDRKHAEKEAEGDRKCAEKEAEKAQRVAKAVGCDAKWTTGVNQSIESMINDGVSFSKITSKLGNGLTETDIKNRWYIIEEIIRHHQNGFQVELLGLRMSMQRLSE